MILILIYYVWEQNEMNMPVNTHIGCFLDRSSFGSNFQAAYLQENECQNQN